MLVDQRGLGVGVKEEARTLLAARPAPLSPEELANARYRITDLLMDLESADAKDAPFITIALVSALANLICDSHEQWCGAGKWIPRAIRSISPALAERLASSLAAAMGGDTQPLVDLTDEALNRIGGRLFEGYAAGKQTGR